MLDKLKQLLQRELFDDADTGNAAHLSVRLTAAALMVEVIAADYHFKDEERNRHTNLPQIILPLPQKSTVVTVRKRKLN
jgi:uncharacterized tellurite resistance protein B-like protein